MSPPTSWPLGHAVPGLRGVLQDALRVSLHRIFARRSAPATPRPGASTERPHPASPEPALPLAGTQPGWLRVLGGEQVLQSVQAERALRDIWQQTRQSDAVWQRDLYPAIVAYAELVQLLPASEAHHHAHVGGLIAHTLETLLAAITWRNGVLLPSGAPIEVIDAQRDEWTVVVFLAALLHDVAKVLTDLVVTWRTGDMPDALPWMPLAGALTHMSRGRAAAEYLVQFRPQAERDYAAHARAAVLLLPRVAPASALTSLARQPQAFEALHQFLSGQARESAVAQIVRDADKASAQRALLTGHKARFATAAAVPLVERLMQALQTLLQEGTALPLNRSGAAGWVYDEALWLVAKRVADATRAWIQAQAPRASVPGETLNDRLFDTWQEHGCLTPHPRTGKAIWYIAVHGHGADPGAPVADGGSSYCHRLSVLRFPLHQLYADPSQWPPAMRGHVEVLAKRDATPIDGPTESVEDAATGRTPAAAQDAAASTEPPPAPEGHWASMPAPGDSLASTSAPVHHEPPSLPLPRKREKAPQGSLKAPTFNRPRATPGDAAGTVAPPLPDDGPGWSGAETPTAPSKGRATPRRIFDDLTLTDELTASLPPHGANLEPGKGAELVAEQASAPSAADGPTLPAIPPPLLLPRTPFHAMRDTEATPPAERMHAGLPAPVLLQPKLPKVVGREPLPATASALALQFITWLQQGLTSLRLPYNQAGAAVHFVPEGMALVSPVIFKRYALEQGDEPDSEALAMRVQREVIRAGWHLSGPNRTNIVRYAVIGRGSGSGSGSGSVGKLAAVVLVNPGRWVQPVPPSNPALRLD